MKTLCILAPHEKWIMWNDGERAERSGAAAAAAVEKKMAKRKSVETEKNREIIIETKNWTSLFALCVRT